MTEKRYHLYIMIAGCIFGSVSIFSALLRNLNVSSLQQAILRSFFAMLFLLPLVLKKGILIKGSDIRFFTLFGFIMALMGLSENTAIALKTPVAVTILLIYTQPVWTAVLSRILLKEDLAKRKVIAIILSLFGVVLITEFWKTEISGFLGPAIALFAGFMLSCEFVLTKISTKRNLHFSVSLFYSYIFRFLFTVILGMALSFFVSEGIVTDFTLSIVSRAWILLVFYAFFPMFCGMMILFFSMRYVQASVAGILLLLEPVSAVFYSHIILGEAIETATVFGGIFILFSSLLAMED